MGRKPAFTPYQPQFVRKLLFTCSIYGSIIENVLVCPVPFCSGMAACRQVGAALTRRERRCKPSATSGNRGGYPLEKESVYRNPQRI